MALGNNISGGTPSMENPQGRLEKASNLSETAQFVKPYLDRITNLMREMKLVQKANELIAKKSSASSPEGLDFTLACKEAEAKVIEGLRKEKGEDPKGEAVVRNYFNKLTASLG